MVNMLTHIGLWPRAIKLNPLWKTELSKSAWIKPWWTCYSSSILMVLIKCLLHLIKQICFLKLFSENFCFTDSDSSLPDVHTLTCYYKQSAWHLCEPKVFMNSPANLSQLTVCGLGRALHTEVFELWRVPSSQAGCFHFYHGTSVDSLAIAVRVNFNFTAWFPLPISCTSAESNFIFRTTTQYHRPLTPEISPNLAYKSLNIKLVNITLLDETRL